MAQLYPEEVIQEVSTSNDIVEVVSEYVKLKRSGSTLLGLCPFHKEKTPSFSVSQDKQLFHCFGCGAGGTVINFIMRIENLDFIEAIKLLAERARIDLPEANSQGFETQKFEKKERVLKINVEAARFFYNNLVSPAGNRAKEYLAKRSIRNKTIVNFGLGYALNSRDGLMKYLIEKGYKIDDILDAGLIIKNEQRGYFDRFRDRVIFPIIDIRGRVVGFGGRVLNDSLPKYLNSPETIVFNKSRNLYGLNFAKNAGNKELIIVEGYMDVISLQQNGIINTVASLGTALTEEQAKMLKKYCQEVVVAYDADTAGQAATLRGIDILAQAGCRVKVLTIPEVKDPDEYIRTKGVERFKLLVEQSMSLVDYKIKLLKKKYNLNDIQQKIDFLNEMAQIFANIDNSIERDAYVQKVALDTGISYESIFTEIKKYIFKNNNKRDYRVKDSTKSNIPNPLKYEETNVVYEETEKVQQNKIRVPAQSNMEKRGDLNNNLKKHKLFEAEKLLLNVLCFDKAVFAKVEVMIGPGDYSNEVHRKLAAIIYDLREREEIVDVTKIVLSFGNDEAGTVAAILNTETNFEDNYKAALELINTIRKEKEINKIKESLEEGNVEKLNTLLIELRHKTL